MSNRRARKANGVMLRAAAVGLMLGLVLALACAGCTAYKADERMAYWRAELARNLPVGSSQAEAEAFFAARGATLSCCVSGPPGAAKYHLVHERNVGQGIIMEYDVAVLVDLGADQRVHSVRVERWGVGF